MHQQHHHQQQEQQQLTNFQIQQQQQSQTTTNHSNFGDLHFPKQTQHVDDDQDVVEVDGTAETQKMVADLSDEFKVSKPRKRQSQQIQQRSEIQQTNNNNNCKHNSMEGNYGAQSSSTANKCCVEHFSCVKPANANGTHTCYAGAFKTNIELVESRCIVQNSEGAMRLNVPAAVQTAESGPISVTNDPDIGGVDISRTSGTLLGTVMPQGSLTIHVNQSDHLNGQKHQDVVNHASGVSIVNCYRAVPVQIVNSAISEAVVQIVNKSNDKCDINKIVETKKIEEGNEVIGELPSEPNLEDLRNTNNNNNNQPRTFTSTEAQTDSLQDQQGSNPSNIDVPSTSILSQSSQPILSQTEAQLLREQRRRDRRERRIARNARQQHIHPAPSMRPPFEILPDILHSHVPPPYTTLPIGTAAPPVPPPVLVPSIITPLPVGPPDDSRYTFPLPIMRR